jgi:membrane-bound metal-dependent hydrolase YbcI (DUF457 family)
VADLLTHAALGYVVARPLRDPKARALVLAGTALPDVLYKGLVLGVGSNTWFAEPTHAPLVLVAICGLAAMFFEPALRRRAFWGLLVGSLLHVLLDLGKDYLGHGVILWAFPFSMDRAELGLYTNDQAVFFIPVAAGLIVITELAVRHRDRRIGARLGSRKE